MRQNGSIQVQDPSASPTYALSEPANNPSVPTSLRRNLFASHLSRRAVPQHATVAADTVIDSFQPQIIASSTTTRWHPSHDRNVQSQSLAQSMHHNQYTMNTAMHTAYLADPRAPTPRSLSPNKNQLITSSSISNIIALDSATGRPALPILPTLPSHFHTGETNEEEDTEEGDPEDEDGNDPDMDYDHSHGGVPHRRTRTQTHPFDRPIMSQHDLDLHSSSIIGPPQPRLHNLLDTDDTTTPDTHDYDKIESILSEMQSLQKARARTVLPHYTSMTSSHLVASDTPSLDSRVSARTRGKSRAVVRGTPGEQSVLVGNESGSGNGSSQVDMSPGKPRVGGVGATLKNADREELLSLIMTSLSRRVAEVDGDAWMFGGGAVGDGFGGGLRAGGGSFGGVVGE